ncbi:oxidoreductase, partial [Rhizobiaceae sp. 2RAB30]
MARIVDTIERGAGPIVLAVFNAGMYHPTRGEKLTAENFVRTYATNLFGVIHGLIPTVERMR